MCLAPSTQDTCFVPGSVRGYRETGLAHATFPPKLFFFSEKYCVEDGIQFMH